jgi:multiple sugar transport system permease protein
VTAYYVLWNIPIQTVVALGLAIPLNRMMPAALQSAFSEQWNLVLAASLVTLVPLLVIFVLFQKQIVRSIQLSGVNR